MQYLTIKCLNILWQNLDVFVSVRPGLLVDGSQGVQQFMEVAANVRYC